MALIPASSSAGCFPSPSLPTVVRCACSGDVFINGIPAARAHVDVVDCHKHSPPYPPIATGSATVFINGQPAARVDDKAGCSAVITNGSHNVFIGGDTIQTDVLQPENLVPAGVHAALLVVGVESAIVLGGPIVATAGLVGGVAGQFGGEWLGGNVFGIGSDGQKWSILVGALLGGVIGAKGGTGLAGRWTSRTLLKASGIAEAKLYEAKSGTLRETGARQIINPNEGLRAYDLSENEYVAIRTDPADIAAISKNTGFAESRVARIKDHVFFKEHQLDSGIRRFDADPDMVNAWNRLTKGDFVKSDIDLLCHEIFESKFESIFKTNYRQAHDAAIRAGRTWIPE